MPKFSKKSQDKLNTCHPDLIRLFNRVVESYDCTILEGHRSEEAQNIAFFTGKSKVKYPGSKHNSQVSMALDAAPFPIDWYESRRFYHFDGFVKATALSMGIDIRSGGDWDGDNDFNDQDFNDLVHFELVEQE